MGKWENWAILKICKNLSLGGAEVQMHLPGHELMQWIKWFWIEDYGSGSKQCNGVGQQAHDPSQAQTIQEKLAQSELVFVIGLRGFDPRTCLSQQLLRNPGTQWNRAEHNFVIARMK